MQKFIDSNAVKLLSVRTVVSGRAPRLIRVALIQVARHDVYRGLNGTKSAKVNFYNRINVASILHYLYYPISINM